MIEFKIKLYKNLVIIAKHLVALAFVAVLNLFPFGALAGIPQEQPSSRAAALAYSVTSLTDGWSLFHNQAGLGYQEHSWIGVHHENRFITPELNFSALGGIIPVKSGALGISIKRLGFSQFNQTKAGLAYGMKLAPTLSVGVQLNAHHIYFAGEYGSTTAFSAEGGILYSPTNNFSVGVHVINPTRSRLHDEERIPTLLNLGLSYQLSEMLMVTAGAEKNLDADFSFKAGIEFVPINNLYFRTGMASKPSLISFGIGYIINAIQIDIAFTRHEFLGYTPHFSLAYTFGSSHKVTDKAP